MVQEVARQMVEQNGRAALRIIHGLIEHAVKTDDYWAAEPWRNVETHVRKELVFVALAVTSLIG
jgi:hypothetical protein